MAESMTESWHEQNQGAEKYKILKIAIVSAADGSFATTSIARLYMDILTTGKEVRYHLTEVYADPGGTAPTDGSSFEIQQSSFGTPDVMEGGMAGVSNATSARFTPPVRQVLVFEQLKIKWTGNIVNSGNYDLYLFFERF